MDKISLEKFNNIKNDYKKNKNNEDINKDQLFFRVINNSDIYALIKVDENKAEEFWIKETIFIQNTDDNNNKMLEAKINNIVNLDKHAFLIVEFNKFIKEWLNLRKKEIKVVKNIYEGLIIPQTAVLPTSDGYKVVKIDSNNKFGPKNIEVVFSNNKNMIVKGLQLGDEIVVNPAQSNFEIKSDEGGNNNE